MAMLSVSCPRLVSSCDEQPQADPEQWHVEGQDQPREIARTAVLLAREPFVGSLPAGEPAGRELRPAFRCWHRSRLDRSWDALTHDKRELRDAGGVIARDDVLVPPLHHSFPERMVEVGRVDQHEGRLDAFTLGSKQAE